MGQIAYSNATAHSYIRAIARMRLARYFVLLGRQYAIPVEFSGILPRSRDCMDAYRLRSLIYCSSKLDIFIPFFRRVGIVRIAN